MRLIKTSKGSRFLTLLRFLLDNKIGGYRCRSQVPEHEILKLVRMYHPIISDFFDNQEEVNQLEKWKRSRKKQLLRKKMQKQ